MSSSTPADRRCPASRTFAPRYDRLLRRLEEAITRYERP